MDEQLIATPATSPASPAVEAQLHGALLGVMRVMREHLERVSAAHGLTHQQAVSLLRLGLVDSLSMRQLADDLSCDPSNVTGIADRLEERGLITRQSRAGDRRVKLLHLTPAGQEVRAALADQVSRSIPGLSALHEADQQELLRILHDVLAASGGSPVHSAPDATSAPD